MSEHKASPFLLRLMTLFFWAMALASLGRSPEAADALSRVARMNSVNGWAFHEWFHGRTGEPRGMPGQSWNAAASMR